MGFDIFYQPCRFGPEKIERPDPHHPGRTRMELPDEPLTAAELAAVHQVLMEVDARILEVTDLYSIQLADGGLAQLCGGNLSTGCIVTCRRMSPGLLQFLFDLLEAGQWAMIPAMEDLLAITATPERLRTPAKFLKSVVCKSPQELGELIAGGYETWQKYRDHVVTEHGFSPATDANEPGSC